MLIFIDKFEEKNIILFIIIIIKALFIEFLIL